MTAVIELENMWEVSSVGRASDLHSEGHRFESYTSHHLCGGVAQLVRAPACHAGGRRFEPGHSRHTSNAFLLVGKIRWRQNLISISMKKSVI